MHFFAYNNGSHGARELARNLNANLIRHSNSRFHGASHKTVVNWGASEVTREVLKCNVVNPPGVVGMVANKLLFFRHLRERDFKTIPDWTESQVEAMEYITDDGSLTVCRTILSGHSGAGIILATSPEQVVRAPLYTRYFKKKDEYRVHVFRGEVICVQRKAARAGFDIPNWKIRNHENGFIYQHHNFEAPPAVLDAATGCMAAFPGLDFGAVDVLWNDKGAKAAVLEINTAPGLEGLTLQAYTAALRSLVTR